MSRLMIQSKKVSDTYWKHVHFCLIVYLAFAVSGYQFIFCAMPSTLPIIAIEACAHLRALGVLWLLAWFSALNS